MNPQERKATIALASIYALRMLGLMMIIPVFYFYAQNLIGSTSLLIGIAMGIHGLLQGILQIPFGMLSDRYGRKIIITIGLLIFAAGSLLAANANNIYEVILGRGLQGAGAISSAMLALLADNTSENQRTKAMAIIGITIGASFSIAFILGPLLNNILSVSGIFLLTALFAILAIIILHVFIPTNKLSVPPSRQTALLSQFMMILKNLTLWRFNIGIFILHAILIANFLYIPTMLEHTVGLPVNKQWHAYLPVLFITLLTVFPLIKYAEVTHKTKLVFLSGIVLLIASQLGWLILLNRYFCLFFLLIFFIGFSLLEAFLPSLVSKASPSHCKGTALGIYSSCQFLGIFIGGAAGGFIAGHFQQTAILVFSICLGIIWFILAFDMQFMAKTS